nr:K304 [uncultured bacterium]
MRPVVHRSSPAAYSSPTHREPGAIRQFETGGGQLKPDGFADIVAGRLRPFQVEENDAFAMNPLMLRCGNVLRARLARAERIF